MTCYCVVRVSCPWDYLIILAHFSVGETLRRRWPLSSEGKENISTFLAAEDHTGVLRSSREDTWNGVYILARTRAI